MMIKCDNLSVELSDRLEDFDYYTDEPCTIFVKKNLLDRASYQKLAKEIYELSNFNFQFNGNGEKLKKTINGSNLSELQEGVFKNYCQAFLSKRFFSWFEKTHLPRFKNAKKAIYIRKPDWYLMKLIISGIKFFRIPMLFYFTEIEYSSIKTGGYIPPHTDSRNKRLSFVHYIHSDDVTLTESEKEQLGIVFWKPRTGAKSPLKRFDCSLLNGRELSQFYDDYEPGYKCAYEANLLVGFIKSDQSWHTVEKFTVDYDRRAIVINVYEL